jgi:hypothetical protein
MADLAHCQQLGYIGSQYAGVVYSRLTACMQCLTVSILPPGMALIVRQTRGLRSFCSLKGVNCALILAASRTCQSLLSREIDGS